MIFPHIPSDMFSPRFLVSWEVTEKPKKDKKEKKKKAKSSSSSLPGLGDGKIM